MRALFGLSTAALLITAAGAQTDCAAIKDAQERLACFDGAGQAGA